MLNTPKSNLLTSHPHLTEAAVSALAMGGETLEALFEPLLDSEVLKAIPLVSSLIAIAKLGASVPDILFAVKVKKFLFGYAQVNAAKDDLADEIWFTAETRIDAGRIVAETLNAIDDPLKATMIGALYAKLLARKVDFQLFRRFCSIINRSFSDDLVNFWNYGDQLVDGLVVGDFHLENLSGTGFTKSTSRTNEYGGGARPLKHKITGQGRTFISLMQGLQF